MNSPTLLLFDLGGVLTENATFANLNGLLPKPLDSASIKERWLFSPTVRRFELGEISPNDFAESFIAEWEIRLSSEEFLEEFMSWSKGFFPGARETIIALRHEYRVGCLSNSNPLHWEKFGGYDGDFDITLFSHLLGVIKPDPEAFTLALSKSEVDPSEVCFFDDSAPNVHTAKCLGIRAFHVEGFDSLRHVLRTEGLLGN